MKRKLFVFLLSMTMSMSLLVGCGESASDNTENTGNTVTEQSSASNENESVVDNNAEVPSDSSAADSVVDDNSGEQSSESEEPYVEVTSINGVKVKVYYDPDVITILDCFDMEFTVKDVNGKKQTFGIADFDSAEAFQENRKKLFASMETRYQDVNFSEIENGGVGSYQTKSYWIDYATPNSNGELEGINYLECIIELDSGVVCVYDGTYSWEYPEEFGTLMNALTFVVE